MTQGLSDAKGLLLPIEVCDLLCDVLPRASDLDAAMSVIDGVRQTMLGDGLLTLNRVSRLSANADEFELQRIWSSNSQAYPVAGVKRKTLTPWSRQLLLRCEVFVAEGESALTAVFDDHARITELGLHSVINVPLVVEGRCVATFNLLGRHAQWQSGDVMLTRLLAMLVRPWVLQNVYP